MADLQKLEMEDDNSVSSLEEHRGLLPVHYDRETRRAVTVAPGVDSGGRSRSTQHHHHLRARWCILLSLVLASFLLLWWRPAPPYQASHHEDVLFTCPAVPSAITVNGDDQHSYDHISQQILENATEYFKAFRQVEYDDWGKTYVEVKERMYDWKVRHFADLPDGGSIYESACGIGLNLFMTLEILEEVKSLRNVKVFGNEYVRESVDVANLMLETIDWPGNASAGAICHGDSTSIPFVPADSFDLVFSGYITPLLDPLDQNERTAEEGSYTKLIDLCYLAASDPESKRLLELIQERQEAWYDKWISEMIRIAKPGAPVIAEQISYPLCDSPGDWGGVEPDFWRRAIETYEWDVDPESLDMERDHVFEGEFDRYHVFMRKNGLRP